MSSPRFPCRLSKSAPQLILTRTCSAQSVDLAGLNLGLLNLGSVDLQDSLAVAEGILALMNSFCLAQVVDLNAVLGLGIDDEVDMFLELAQLAQLESLGFLNVLGAQNLIESNLLFNGNEDVLNIGELLLVPQSSPPPPPPPPV